MAAKNIEDLEIGEITEEFLLDECIDMGDELGVDTNQGSIYRDAADGHINRTAKFFNDLSQVAEIISIFSCSGDILDERLRERALQRNPPEDTPAVYFVEFVGAEPEPGEIMTCDDHFFVAEKIDGKWVIRSEETGTDMNHLVPGLPVIPENDVDGLISATLRELAVPAVDMENDDSARERLLSKVSGPDGNGNKSQIRSWCKEIAGVGEARIIPLWNGPDTVCAVLVGTGGEVPSSLLVSDVQEYVDPGAQGLGEGKATIGQCFTAIAAQKVSVKVSVTVIKKADYTEAEVCGSFKTALTEYFKGLALQEYTKEASEVRYSRIGAMLSAVPGVNDYENLLVNDGNVNVAFSVWQVPVLGEVSVNGYIL